MAASSSGSAWSQPQRCSAPCVTRRRSSSAGCQATSPVWPAAALRGLLDGALDGDDDVAQVDGLARGQGEGRASGRSLAQGRVLAGVRREGRRRQEREGEHVGRAVLAHVGGVQLGQLGIVAEGQRDRGVGRCAGGVERGQQDRGQLGVRQQVGHAGAAADVDAGLGWHRGSRAVGVGRLGAEALRAGGAGQLLVDDAAHELAVGAALDLRHEHAT